MNTESKNKFQINKIKLFSTWCFNLENNTDCTICRRSLNENSIYVLESGGDSYVVSGMCGHSFHYECIQPWIKNNHHCPICSSKGIYKK